MPEGTRELAARIAALSDGELRALLRSRGIPAAARWNDFFDAAEALATPASAARALATLPREELVRLVAGEGGADASADAATDAPSARDMLLTDASGGLRPETRAVLDELDLEASVAPPDGRGRPDATPEADARAAETAFTAIADLADLLLAAERAPLALIGSGALSSIERRRFEDELRAPADIEHVRALAESAGLLAATERELRATPAAAEWLRAGPVGRWTHVARAWDALVPGGLRDAASWRPADEWPGAYPADPTWSDRARDLLERARVWGIVTPDGAVPAFARALRTSGTDDDVRAGLAPHLPPEVERIYLQNDLSAIAPGPLAGPIDARLRRMAQRESHAQASTYRFTADTVEAALAAGEDGASILAFLAEISLTGVPQPLDYLVRTTAQRHGSVRVRDREGGGAVVTATDGDVFRTIAVDQALRSLALQEDEGELVSAADRDTVVWALRDARYPAVPVRPDGSPAAISLRRRPGASASGAAEPAAAGDDPYAPLIARLRDAGGADAERAWFERDLAQAAQGRAHRIVEVELPGGESRAFVLEVTGLSGGRVRGRDLAADVERTLPLSHVRSIRPADGG